MNDGRDGVRVCFGCRCAPSRAGWGSTRRGAGRFARARRCALYRETYLHDRHVHDGLHPLDAAHGRLGHGAREIDRSVASRAKRPNAECPGNARGSSGERATFGPTRRGARGGVARATGSRWSPEKRPDDWRRCVRDRAFMARAKRTLRNRAIWPSACLPIRNSKPALSLHRYADRRQLTEDKLGDVSVRSLRPVTLTARNRRRDSTCVLPAPRRFARCVAGAREYPAPRVRKSRDSPIVARVVRAIGRG
jgi:hypothetical protein